MTSLVIGSLDLNDGITYALMKDSRYALDAQTPKTVSTISMANRTPVFGGLKLASRSVPLMILLLDPTRTARTTAANAVIAAFDPPNLTPITWSDGPSTFLAHLNSAAVEGDFRRLALDIVIPDPVPR